MEKGHFIWYFRTRVRTPKKQYKRFAYNEAQVSFLHVFQRPGKKAVIFIRKP